MRAYARIENIVHTDRRASKCTAGSMLLSFPLCLHTRTPCQLWWFQVRVSHVYVYTLLGWAEPAAQSGTLCVVRWVFTKRKKKFVTSSGTLLAKYVNVYHKSNHLPVCMERLIGTSCVNVCVFRSLCLCCYCCWYSKQCELSGVWYRVCTISVFTHTYTDTDRHMDTYTARYWQSLELSERCTCVCVHVQVRRSVHRNHHICCFAWIVFFPYSTLFSSQVLRIVYSISFNRTHTLCANTYVHVDIHILMLCMYVCMYRNKIDTHVICTKTRPTNMFRTHACVWSLCAQQIRAHTKAKQNETDEKSKWAREKRTV